MSFLNQTSARYVNKNVFTYFQNYSGISTLVWDVRLRVLLRELTVRSTFLTSSELIRGQVGSQKSPLILVELDSFDMSGQRFAKVSIKPCMHTIESWEGHVRRKQLLPISIVYYGCDYCPKPTNSWTSESEKQGLKNQDYLGLVSIDIINDHRQAKRYVHKFDYSL